MNNLIKIRRGLDLKLKGAAEKITKGEVSSKIYSIKPADFESFVPKLVLKPENPVKRGETVFYDKYNSEVCFVSPVSGKILDVVRGEKRKILEIIIESDDKDEVVKHDTGNFFESDRKKQIELILKAGLWPYIKQRPYGTIADQNQMPRDIFISFFDSAPLAPDLDFILIKKKEEINIALKFISGLTEGKTFLSFRPDSDLVKLIDNKGKYEINYFKGPHPSGLPGIQINKLKPINKGEILWTLNASDLPIIGNFIKTGEYLPERMFALTGSEIKAPAYYKCLAGCNLKELIEKNTDNKNIRIISGNVLTGKNITESPHIGFFSTSVTVLPEGNKHELFGWAMPGLNKLSKTNAFLSKLFFNKKFTPDTNLHGGYRALVVTGQYEQVCPMDIYPQLLIKAILSEDIDKMEQLGIYEVLEEDFALCEFVCTSKTEIQEILRQGFDLMIKETT